MPNSRIKSMDAGENFRDWRLLIPIAFMLVGAALAMRIPDLAPIAMIWAPVIFSAIFLGPRVVGALAAFGLALSLITGIVTDVSHEVTFWIRILFLIAVSVFTVLLARRRSLREVNLWNLATTDELTGLANRRLLITRLEAQLAVRGTTHDSAVIYTDLDDFKRINDSFGHAIGDQILVLAAERLGTCIRSADTLARFGGDEFVIAIPVVDGVEGLSALCERMLDAFKEPLKVGMARLSLGITLGAAIIAASELTNPQTLIDAADKALVEVKRTTTGSYKIIECD
ncbi:MAG: GGDEF domain-containing protein [Candidatus Nanopelagicales bacterium]